MTRIFTISALIFLVTSCTSKGHKFKIDSSISNSIDSIFEANELNNTPIKPDFSFHVVKTFDYNQFGQNGMDLAYFLQADDYNSTDVYVNSITECFLSKGTIVLVGGLFSGSGIGFKITIYENKCDAKLFVTSTDKIYSKTENKKDLEKEMIVKSDSLSMTLTQKPDFKIGSSIKGKIKIKSAPFYQLDKQNVLFKINPQFDVIFDTKIKEREKK